MNPGRLVFCLSLLLAAAAPAQTITATLLGTAGPSLSMTEAEAGLLIQAGPEVLLFDCGHLIPERLAQLGIYNVTKVFLSHVHSDHVEGLPILWMNELMWEGRGNSPLQVFGPPQDPPNQPSGTVDITYNLTSGFATNTHIRRDLVEHLPAGGIEFQTIEIKPGTVYQNNGVTVTAFLVHHDPVMPAYGYRVDYAGHSVVFSGDTTEPSGLVQAAKGADVLIHEVLINPPAAVPATDVILSYHTTPEQAAAVFTQVNPKLAVYTHIVAQIPGGASNLISRTQAAGYTGPLLVGTDLTSITIGDTVTVNPCNAITPPVTAAVAVSGHQPPTINGTVTPPGGNVGRGCLGRP